MTEPTLLYVSDDPERFTLHSRLFHAAFPSDGSTIRFLFDHVNGVGAPMRVTAGVYNGGGNPATVSMVGGCAGPDPNGMNVGHLATLRFIQAHEAVGATAASLHAIPPGGTFALADYVLQPDQCVAGLFDLQCPVESVCEVRIIACDPSHDQVNVFDLLPEAADDGKTRRGIFDTTGMSDVVDLSYSGAADSTAVGDRACPRAASDTYGGADYAGGYGVMRNLVIAAQSDACVYQSARGGSATATYYVNGRLWASHQIPAKARSKVCRVGAGQTVSLVTMAEINSSYPLDLIVDQNDTAVADAGDAGSPLHEV
ncbi:MAG: hypothetical protein WA215_06015 [Candidatus Cybelea sp.]